MKFTKMQGNGNDFIVIDNILGEFGRSYIQSLAPSLCRRKISLGGDGVLLLEKSLKGDFFMRLFNSDGSEGEMCGNGARCVARYAFERSLAGEEMCFETLSGMISARVEGQEVTLDMGRIDLGEADLVSTLDMEGLELEYFYLMVGVPHCVIFMGALDAREKEWFRDTGRKIRNYHTVFPGGTNVNFVEIIDRNTIKAVTYERGVEDLTLSCGTGSTASAIAAHLIHKLDQPVRVINPGGDNVVGMVFENSTTCRASLKGKTAIVAHGEFSREALEEAGKE